MTPNHIMPESEKQQRLSKVHSLIQSKTFSGDKLVYSFVLVCAEMMKLMSTLIL